MKLSSVPRLESMVTDRNLGSTRWRMELRSAVTETSWDPEPVEFHPGSEATQPGSLVKRSPSERRRRKRSRRLMIRRRRFLNCLLLLQGAHFLMSLNTVIMWMHRGGPETHRGGPETRRGGPETCRGP